MFLIRLDSSWPSPCDFVAGDDLFDHAGAFDALITSDWMILDMQPWLKLFHGHVFLVRRRHSRFCSTASLHDLISVNQ
jgi:hypothetical protein